jgi:uncharacterized membrane protein
MLAHVVWGHAGAATNWRGIHIIVQWAHFMGVGIWIGGLAALLLILRGTPNEAKVTAARRFSGVAGVALVVVALTGLVRAVDEVGTLSRLLSTPFGQLVILKSVFFLILVILGAMNRYRLVPAAGWTLRGLRRIGGIELVVATLVLVVTALLTGLPPASYTQEAAGQASSVKEAGKDFATSVRADLEVTPGYPGSNRFVVSLRDYDTGMPLRADRVSLRFVLGSRPEIASSTLPLTEGSDGVYRGQGSNLSLHGSWTVTVIVEHGPNSTEVPITVTTRSRPQQVHTIRAPGQPTLYVVDFPDKRSVQVYIDPEHPGSTQVHVTYFDDRGNELPIAREITLRMTQGDQPPRLVPVRRFGPGHFIADVTVGPGSLRFELEAMDPQGAPLRAALLIQF